MFLIKKLSLLVRYYVVIWRLYKHKQRYKPEDTTLNAIISLALCIDYTLLNNYNRNVTKDWFFEIGVKNSEDLLDWFDVLIDKIRNKQFIQENDVTRLIYKKEVYSLENFLTANNGGRVNPALLWNSILLKLFELDSALETNQGDTKYLEYYHPKITMLLKEVFTILEGLLTAALSYE